MYSVTETNGSYHFIQTAKDEKLNFDFKAFGEAVADKNRMAETLMEIVDKRESDTEELPDPGDYVTGEDYLSLSSMKK
ncbi:hypothetical protein [Limisalsivibrio acetivorans]|uniref:hypothetical protein n=1 Tax=Limisalsivibrio acetivorans TaxID=1304888 RepID=UPI0003B62FED|nr:hypothetical protein [Limisalsivibrio acetivorans]